VVFEAEADYIPGFIPGNIVIVFQEKEHSEYRRDGNNLLKTQSILLSEALCGGSFMVTCLDGRKLLLTSNDVISPGDVKTITGEGMPIKGSNARGNLLITFKVLFPKKKDIDLFSLRSLLPRSNMKINLGVGEDIEERAI
jgi:DnaJ-class molecular chaperone